jgi:hypothetical protein
MVNYPIVAEIGQEQPCQIEVNGVLLDVEPKLDSTFQLPIRIMKEIWPGEKFQPRSKWPVARSWREKVSEIMWRWQIWAYSDEIERHVRHVQKMRRKRKKNVSRFIRIETLGIIVTRERFEKMANRLLTRSSPRLSVLLKKSLWKIVRIPVLILAILIGWCLIFALALDTSAFALILWVTLTMYSLLELSRHLWRKARTKEYELP